MGNRVLYLTAVTPSKQDGEVGSRPLGRRVPSPMNLLTRSSLVRGGCEHRLGTANGWSAWTVACQTAREKRARDQMLGTGSKIGTGCIRSCIMWILV
jgi:hypothetical protein